MQLPGAPSLFFLLFILLLLPYGAWRTAQRLRGTVAGPPISRTLYWQSAIRIQLVMLVVAGLTGWTFGYPFLDLSGVDLRAVLLTVAALLACLAIRELSRRSRAEAELRELSVYARAPRTTGERQLFLAAVAVASVAEEAAYRGVGFSILWYSSGNPWLAAGIIAVAFTLAHWTQGWKSGLAIFGVALVLQALVVMTNTLLLAVVVHALYDLIVGEQIRRRALAYDREAIA